MVVDLSYVGDHAYNQFGGTQGGSQVLVNQVPLGQAYLAQYQDPTLGTSTVPGAAAYTTNLLRPFAGLSTIGQNTTAYNNLLRTTTRPIVASPVLRLDRE